MWTAQAYINYSHATSELQTNAPLISGVWRPLKIDWPDTRTCNTFHHG